MLKIGDFSRVAHVTIKALRHYGRLGLLRPTWVDRFSGYRYYSLDQLPRLNRILALKEMGFSLEQIAGMLDREPGVDELRSILHQKRSELEERLRAEQDRLDQLEARLERIDQSGPGEYEVALKCVPDQPAIFSREMVVDPRLAPQHAREMRARMLGELQRIGLRPAGPWVSITHNPEYAERNLDLEVAVIVDLGANGAQRARRKPVRILPGAAQMASVVYSGPDSDLHRVYAALYAWMDTNTYHPLGPVREVCHADPDDESGKCRVFELQMPVAKASPPHFNQSSTLTQEEQSMEPKFVTKPAFMLVGMKYVGKNQHNEIAAMWGKFAPFIEPLASKPIQATYGWCGMPEQEVEEGAFEYVAAVETQRADNLPDWAVVRMIPGLTYAVFPHVGPAEKIKDTYHEIYQTWLPQSGYESAAPFDMEVYTDEFKDFGPDSVMYIYLPVKKK